MAGISGARSGYYLPPPAAKVAFPALIARYCKGGNGWEGQGLGWLDSDEATCAALEVDVHALAMLVFVEWREFVSALPGCGAVLSRETSALWFAQVTSEYFLSVLVVASCWGRGFRAGLGAGMLPASVERGVTNWFMVYRCAAHAVTVGRVIFGLRSHSAECRCFSYRSRLCRTDQCQGRPSFLIPECEFTPVSHHVGVPARCFSHLKCVPASPPILLSWTTYVTVVHGRYDNVGRVKQPCTPAPPCRDHLQAQETLTQALSPRPRRSTARDDLPRCRPRRKGLRCCRGWSRRSRLNTSESR